MTLVVRDDADALEAQLLFHLNAGVDLALVAVDGPSDDTLDVLARFEREGGARRLPLPEKQASAARAGMARVAAAEHSAEWVLPVGDGEFWWSHGGSLAELLSRIAARYDVVQALVRPFPPVLGAGEPFHESMIYRLSTQAQIGDERNPLRPSRRYAHRPVESVEFGELGQVAGTGFKLLRGWYPIEVLWFPFRSDDRAGVDPAWTRGDYASLALDRTEIERGIESGTVRVDTRLRDALRSLREGGTVEFPRLSLVESALYAVDTAVLGEGEVVATQRRLDELEGRLGAIEANVGIRLERKLRSFVKRSRTAR